MLVFFFVSFELLRSLRLGGITGGITRDGWNPSNHWSNSCGPTAVNSVRSHAAVKKTEETRFCLQMYW